MLQTLLKQMNFLKGEKAKAQFQKSFQKLVRKRAQYKRKFRQILALMRQVQILIVRQVKYKQQQEGKLTKLKILFLQLL